MKTELEVKETHMENILTVAEATTKSHVFVNGWLRPISREKNHDIDMALRTPALAASPNAFCTCGLVPTPFANSPCAFSRLAPAERSLNENYFKDLGMILSA
ncbi:hypothetical protein P5673_023956 [Acropora cervicornis]|uniref:Uncharacterized protein n=1 Tax=Acropora cervicornis TaxID=6130 RepID=A0AAD9UYD2_ACRCE|nr:hypothetical protein P5673_023956 [Acropora cervicornis]